MTNNKKRHPKKKKMSAAVPLLLIGSGLIILSILGFILWPKDTGSPETEPADPVNVQSSIPIEVEFPAPSLTVNGLDGQAVSLQDYHGKVILVNNWATWCPPCKAEMPTLQEYFEEHSDQDFMIVAIDAGDPTSDIINFVDEYGLTFDVLADPNMTALAAFRNNSLPSSYVIDENGIVRLAWTGTISHEMLEKHVSPLLEN